MIGQKIYNFLVRLDNGEILTDEKVKLLSEIETIYWDESIDCIPNNIKLLK